jgi:hypothetical protein
MTERQATVFALQARAVTRPNLTFLGPYTELSEGRDQIAVIPNLS